MVTISSHTLDSVNGAHAGGIEVELLRLDDAGGRTHVFATQTDPDGRLLEEIEVTPEQLSARYEMVLSTGPYFAGHTSGPFAERIMDEVVVRFRIPATDAKIHIPMMLAPNSYSVWWSA
jgi:5-hydroxyisourate hydrolase